MLSINPKGNDSGREIVPALASNVVCLLGPKYDSVVINGWNSGTVALSVFDGSSFVTVANTLHSYFGYVIALRPTTPTNLLSGIPALESLESYPYARIKTGTITGATNSHKNTDPYEYYGNLQLGPPIVRGCYAKAWIDSTSVTAGASVPANASVWFVWVDGYVDSVDQTLIKVSTSTSIYVRSVTKVPGLGGQLLKLTLTTATGLSISGSDSFIFQEGALSRSGLGNAEQTVTLTASASKRCATIQGITDSVATEDYFKTGTEVPTESRVSSGISRVYPVYHDKIRAPTPSVYYPLEFSAGFVLLNASGEGMPNTDGAYGMYSPLEPEGYAGYPIVKPEVLGSSANAVTANLRSTVIPVTCKGLVSGRARFVSSYASDANPVYTSQGMTCIIHNLTRDVYATPAILDGEAVVRSSFAFTDTQQEEPAAYLAAHPQGYEGGAHFTVKPPPGVVDDWQDGDQCLVYVLNESHVPGSTIRFSTGLYPLLKPHCIPFFLDHGSSDHGRVINIGYYLGLDEFGDPLPTNIGNMLMDIGHWPLLALASPYDLTISTQLGYVSPDANFLTDKPWFEALFPLTLKMIPSIAQVPQIYEYLQQYIWDPWLPGWDPYGPLWTIAYAPAFTETVLTIPMTVTMTAAVFAGYGWIWGPYSYPENTYIAWPAEVPGARWWRASADTTETDEPGVSGVWIDDGPFNSYCDVQVTAVSAPLVIPTAAKNLCGLLAVFPALSSHPGTYPQYELPYGPGQPLSNMPVYFSGQRDTPFHGNVLSDPDKAYQGRVWTSEPVIPFLNP